jgi:hypothetical protein
MPIRIDGDDWGFADEHQGRCRHLTFVATDRLRSALTSIHLRAWKG